MKRKVACLSQVERSRVCAVVVVTIHMEDLLALDGEQAREHTFGQTSAENDDLQAISRVNTHEKPLTSYSSSMLYR